jgi:hypothetical protein
LGYGEAHFGYQQLGELGVLALKQTKRGQWKPGATYLFDKILHSRFNINAGPVFFHGPPDFRGAQSRGGHSFDSQVARVDRLGRAQYR